jgi:DNA-nicking Smr family endonuclease
MAKDLDLFQAAMVGVSPLKGRKTARSSRSRSVVPKPEGIVLPGPKAEGPVGPPERLLAPLGVRRATRTTPAVVEQTFDRDVDRALAKGKRAPQAKLDLHGMTLVAAERAVTHFLADASERGLRVVLIVTGKGLRLEGGRVFGGRIRAEFPGWLERAENRTRVSGVRTAHTRHGGSGAFYVLLRRRSSASSRSLRATPQR